MTYDFRGRVTIDPLRTGIPTDDDAFQVLPVDYVVGRVDNRRQVRIGTPGSRSPGLPRSRSTLLCLPCSLPPVSDVGQLPEQSPVLIDENKNSFRRSRPVSSTCCLRGFSDREPPHRFGVSGSIPEPWRCLRLLLPSGSCPATEPGDQACAGDGKLVVRQDSQPVDLAAGPAPAFFPRVWLNC